MIGLIILGIFVLILLLPVGARVRYNSEGVFVAIAAGPIHITILPRKPKKEKNGKKRKKEKAKKPAKEKKKKDSKEKKPEAKQDLGGKIEFFRQLISTGLDALGCLFHRLRMDQLILNLTVGGKGEDAAAAAILYGRAWAAIGALVPLLQRSFRIYHRDLNAQIDFEAEENTVFAEAQITIRIGSVLWIALHYGLKVLVILLRNRKQKKGGNSNGTCN